MNNENVNIEIELFLSENSSELYNKSIKSEETFRNIFDWELSIIDFISKSNYSTLTSNSQNDTNSFNESLDVDKALILDTKEKTELPLYLKNYLNLSFNNEPVPRDSLVVKIAKEGLKLASAFFESSQFEINPVLSPSTRSIEQSTHSAFNLKEIDKVDPNRGIIYQVIQENREEAYLCINFSEMQDPIYKQVNLRKNNRFIYSGQIDERGIVSFSGLKEGKYNVEFVGNNLAKVIDLTILVDHS